MPIDINEFEAASPDDLRTDGEPAPSEVVLEFLAFSPNKAYSRDEIESATGITGLDLVEALSTLESDGHVRHKGNYWTMTEDADVSVDDGVPW